VARFWYAYGPVDTLKHLPDTRLYIVNDTAFTGRQAHGFRFLANATPHVTKGDVEYWQQHPKEGKERPREGTIRTFEQMARVSRGIRRIGVLRMDLDDLGQILVHRLESRTMAAASTLSAALERFFAGWLNEVCRQVNELHANDKQGKERGNRVYVIYAGGDDLFIVGSWDLMPELAGRIRNSFCAYTGNNPALHISAGITIEGETFPLYQAAQRSGQALEEAKDYSHKKVKKDAITFLSLPVKWDEWQREVLPRLKTIVELTGGDGPAPAALIQILQNVYARYDEQVKRRNAWLREHNKPVPAEPQYRVYYGPWMWREAYALARMANRLHRAGDRDAAAKVRGLAVGTLSPLCVRYVGLAARWAELLIRKEEWRCKDKPDLRLSELSRPMTPICWWRKPKNWPGNSEVIRLRALNCVACSAPCARLR